MCSRLVNLVHEIYEKDDGTRFYYLDFFVVIYTHSEHSKILFELQKMWFWTQLKNYLVYLKNLKNKVAKRRSVGDKCSKNLAGTTVGTFIYYVYYFISNYLGLQSMQICGQQHCPAHSEAK